LFELRDWRPAHRGCQRVIPIIGRTVRRHRHQHRALDAGGIGRFCRRRARSEPHPDSRGQEPAEARGQHMGRPRAPPRHTSRTKPSSAATETLVEIGRSYNISTATISRLSEEDR
jgi:hypothetical protein